MKLGTRCIICNRPLKTSKGESLAMGAVCSKKHLVENNSSLSKIYKQVLKDKLVEDQSMASMNMDLDTEKFKSFNYKVPFKNPEDFTTSIVELAKADLAKLVEKNSSLGGRTPVETLLDASDEDIKEFMNLKIGQKMVKDLLSRMNNNFSLFVREHLYYENCTMLESQVSGVREFVHSDKKDSVVKPYKHLKIKEAIKYDEVSDKESELVVSALQEVSTLIPDKYKKNVPPVTILIRKDGVGQISMASLSKAVLILNVKTNKVLQAAEALHEYVHLVEYFNKKKVMKSSNEFLKTRRTHNQKKTIKSIAEKFNKHYRPSAGEIEVYEDHFTEPYAGRVYGDLDGKELSPTEVLTVGCEIMMLDPIGFSVKDRDYFNFIAKFLKGNL